jgi:hypothetical protein
MKRAMTREQLVYLILISIVLILLSLGVYNLMKKMLRI